MTINSSKTINIRIINAPFFNCILCPMYCILLYNMLFCMIFFSRHVGLLQTPSHSFYSTVWSCCISWQMNRIELGTIVKKENIYHVSIGRLWAHEQYDTSINLSMKGWFVSIFTQTQCIRVSFGTEVIYFAALNKLIKLLNFCFSHNNKTDFNLHKQNIKKASSRITYWNLWFKMK